MKTLLFIIAQYAATDLADNCWEGMGVEETKLCIHTIRVNEGVNSLSQLPHWISLQEVYKEHRAWKEAEDISSHLRWLVYKNNEGADEVIPPLTWMPESPCFDKSDWRYTNWRGDCRELRFMVAESHILAFSIAPEEVKQALALRIAYLVSGILGKPLYVVQDDYSIQINVEIPGKYRSDVWLRRAR